MDKIQEIDDIDQLQNMLDGTEDNEKRKAIRQRLLELKKKRREQTNKNLQDLAEKREKRINDKKSEADRNKDSRRDFYDEMGKTGNVNMDKYKGVGPKQ